MTMLKSLKPLFKLYTKLEMRHSMVPQPKHLNEGVIMDRDISKREEKALRYPFRANRHRRQHGRNR